VSVPRPSGDSPAVSPRPDDSEDSEGEATWYVYDRHATLLHVTATLERAEAWARRHWNVVEVADREEVEANDFYYLLFAAPEESGFHARDHQARIMRRDRVISLGRDPDAVPTPNPLPPERSR
jgi:hypothetical protein